MKKIGISDSDFESLRGNESIKSADSSIFISSTDYANIAEELIKCKNDIVYFAENYFTIISATGKSIIELYPKQKELLNTIIEHKNIAILSSRQAGKCVFFNAKITVRNKKTGIIEDISIGKFYNKLR